MKQTPFYKWLPVWLAVLVVAVAGWFVLSDTTKQTVSSKKGVIKEFHTPLLPQPSCARLPKFLRSLSITHPVLIDLSQQHHTGVALLYGEGFSRVYNPPAWRRFEHMGTYALDEGGNLYLVPTPYISIKPTTFNLQKHIYRIDSRTGKLESFMEFDELEPSARNPYGMISIAYDCKSRTLWAGSIDKSDFQTQKGTIFHIDPKTKNVLQKVTGIDALSLAIGYHGSEKYLLVGSAKEPALFAFAIVNGSLQDKPLHIVDLPDPTLRIRKIKPHKKGGWILEAIAFSYSLVVESHDENVRKRFRLFFDPENRSWALQTYRL